MIITDPKDFVIESPEQVEALRNVLDYLADEEGHFEACEVEDREGHIYTDVVMLRSILETV